MSGRFRVSRLVARQLKDHGIPELAVLRRAGLWDGWLRQDKILATTEELFGFWRAVEEVSGDPRKKDAERKSREQARRVEDLNGRGSARLRDGEGSRLSRRRYSCAWRPPRVGTDLAKPDTLQEWF
jgi:hypothetical protein